ncbi:MAG TPA: prolyl oligopeptidase family serine peptidase [Candidatus Methylacidiphilales bacterium]|nr:prolyl oligopeptidase family serine peptidase [Candidatus Methylacidiphilales bacterium]
MGSITSPPSPTKEPNPAPQQRSSATAPVIFGAVFIIFSALIFTATIHPPPPPPPPPAPAAPVASKPSQPQEPSIPLPSLPLTYPPTQTTSDSDVYFGVKVDDPYRWLEDGKSPEVQAWLGAQNKLARSYLDALPGRAALKNRFGQLLRIETISAPERSGDRLFFLQKRASDEREILYWSPVTNAKSANVLVDPNQFIGKDNATLGEWAPSLDGKLLVYTLKPNNADEATLYVKDVDSGQDRPGEVITGAKYASPSWMPDNSGFVYTYLPPADPAHPENRPGLATVRFHKLGTDPKKDPIIHDKTGDPTMFVDAYISRDGKWIFYEQGNWVKNDIYYHALDGLPTADLADEWRPVVTGQDFLYSLVPWKNQAYILTNENAPNYRIFKVSLTRPRRTNWHEIVPQSPSMVLQGAAVVGDHLVLEELENVTSHLEIRDLDGTATRRVVLPALGTVTEISGEPEHDELYYGFENFTQPPEIFQTSVTNAAQTVWAKTEVPVDPAPYVVDQRWFSSKDGTRVPLFIVHRRDIVMDGSTPFLIYGYGGFSESMTPFFSAGIYAWLEAGGGYALVNLRGGGEFGEKWHQNGMLLKKQNVFDDCIGAAQYLIANAYTKPDRLALRGGSNGGLLAAAVTVQRPDLFRAVVCEVPLTDMIRFPKFGSGKTWITEYGSPDDPVQFKALYAYSPYHHVVKGTPYPSVLICTAENDDRVDPMHARKFAAALQAATSSKNPILLRKETDSGHGGSDQIKKTIEYGTDIWGFLIHELGAKTPEKTYKK